MFYLKDCRGQALTARYPKREKQKQSAHLRRDSDPIYVLPREAAMATRRAGRKWDAGSSSIPT